MIQRGPSRDDERHWQQNTSHLVALDMRVYEAPATTDEEQTQSDGQQASELTEKIAR